MKTRSTAKGKRSRESSPDDEDLQPGPARKKAHSAADDDELLRASMSCRIGREEPEMLIPVPPSHPRTRLSHVKELGQAKREIAELQRNLEEEKRRSQMREKQITQSMFFDLMREQDKQKEMLIALHKGRRELVTLRGELSQAARRHEEVMNQEKAVQLRLLAEREGYRRDFEHQERVCTTLEEDLQELKKLHTEETAAQQNHRLGLPPAYGSLDEQDQRPPWDVHRDAGPTNILYAVELARRMVGKHILEARKAFMTARRVNSGDAAADLMTSLFQSLSGHCYCEFPKWIGKAHVWSDVFGQYLDCMLVDDEEESKDDRERRTHSSLIAQRWLEHTLESITRIVAVLEIQPSTIGLTKLQRSKVRLSTRAIDFSLLLCLRKTFDYSKDRLLDMQFYLTQLNMIHDRINLLWPREGPDALLIDSSTWLLESVEKERQLAAASPH